eukprot:COSAG01_NODE_4818_length_4723_cov_7.881055_6_plen_117_part_00
MIEQPSLDDLATRSTPVVGTGTEVFEVYLIHPTAAVVSAAKTLLAEFFGWTEQNFEEQLPRQKKLACVIAGTSARTLCLAWPRSLCLALSSRSANYSWAIWSIQSCPARCDRGTPG